MEREGGKFNKENRHNQTHAAIEMLAADMGLTSFTSKAFCSASFLLAASSCSSSSYGEQKEPESKA